MNEPQESHDPLADELARFAPRPLSDGLAARLAERLAAVEEEQLRPRQRDVRQPNSPHWWQAWATIAGAALLGAVLLRVSRTEQQTEPTPRPAGGRVAVRLETPRVDLPAAPPGPTLLAYRQAMASGEEELGALLDRHARVLLPRTGGMVSVGDAP